MSAPFCGLKIALVRFVAVEIVVKNSRAFCIRHELLAETDQAARRDKKFETGVAVRWDHILHLAFARAEIFDHRSHKFVGHVDDNMFNRLGENIVNIFIDNFRRET